MSLTTAVFVTHAQPRSQKIVAQLREQGVSAFSLSFQRIFVSENARRDKNSVQQQLGQYDAVAFVSPNAVETFFDDSDLSSIARFKGFWMPVGRATDAALREKLPTAAHGNIVCGLSNDAGSIVASLAVLRQKMHQAKVRECLKVLVVRGQTGREDWIAQCEAAGDQVTILSAYDSIAQDPSIDEFNELNQRFLAGNSVVLVFASTQLVHQLHDWLDKQAHGLLTWAKEQTALAIHPKIAQRLDEFGFVAPKLVPPGVQGIVLGLE